LQSSASEESRLDPGLHAGPEIVVAPFTRCNFRECGFSVKRYDFVAEMSLYQYKKYINTGIRIFYLVSRRHVWPVFLFFPRVLP
jgi:hypothetical protein